jgi:hypothetical protein
MIPNVMKFRFFWDVAACSHVEVDRRFRCAYCFHHQRMKFFALMMGAVRTSQTSLNFNVTTWRYIAERSKLHTYRRENTKSDTKCYVPTLTSSGSASTSEV